VLAALQQYDWPGNVRELETAIERAVVLSRARSSRRARCRSSARPRRQHRPAVAETAQNIEWVEKETIRRALEGARGVKKDAADLMGISQRALSYYLAKYRID
jgi:transcriptional regulator with PAS, ATPase and Fis domain